MSHTQHHDHHARQHADAGADGDAGLLDLLDLDADVLHDYWSSALDWVRQAADGAPRVRLLDLGAGTGTGAIGLAQRFHDAEVVAVDISPESLDRLRVKARDLGLAARVHAVEADLDAGWPGPGVLGGFCGPGALDLTWASMSMHHMADPGRVLRDALAATRPGGLIAVAEFSQPLRFLPEDLGFGLAGFEDRVADVLGRSHAEALPTLGSQWAPRLADAGWQVVAERDFPIDLNPASHPSAPRYAKAWFTRLAQGLDDRLAADDRGTLAALLDESGPRSVLHRTDLRIRGVRSITLGRRD